MHVAADEARLVLVAGILGLGVGLAAALFSLEDRAESFAEIAGVAAAGIAGAAAGIGLVLFVLREKRLAAAMIAIYVGSGLLAVAATRQSSEYESSIVLFLIGAGALLVIAYGQLAGRLLQPTGWRIRAALGVVALAGAVSVATMLAITLPLVIISAWTWRAAGADRVEDE